MKSIRVIAVTLVCVQLLTSCGNNNHSFEVKGDIKGLNNKPVFLELLDVNNISIVDSANSTNSGSFTLKGSAEEPGLYRLRMPNDMYILLAIDKGRLNVSGDVNDLENYNVAGSVPSEGLRNFLSVVRGYMNDFNTLFIVMDSMKARGNDSMLQLAQNEVTDRNNSFTKYIEQYADTVAYLPNALFAVQMLNPNAERDYLQKFSSSIEKRFPNSKTAVAFNDRLKQMIAGDNDNGKTSDASAGDGSLAIGSQAPEIDLPNSQGKNVKLSSLQGKYVLVDFWASWCQPCRAENPNVVAAFNKMKGKNFTIFGVSLDNKKDKWEAAIQEDQLHWPQVSDLKGWESLAARNYNIQSIPANFLLDPEGKIIAKNLRGPELERTLEALVK